MYRNKTLNNLLLYPKQDVSDRIEKADLEDYVVKCLEDGGPEIVKFDWKLHITPELQQGSLLDICFGYQAT